VMTHDSVFALLVVECFLRCAILQGNRRLIHELNLLFPCKHYVGNHIKLSRKIT
jgi:hypothetical protein